MNELTEPKEVQKSGEVAGRLELIVMHPREVIEVLSQLKNRPNFGDTLTKPNHWIMEYAKDKKLLIIGNELCGPLGLKTGKKIGHLTQLGKDLVGA